MKPSRLWHTFSGLGAIGLGLWLTAGAATATPMTERIPRRAWSPIATVAQANPVAQARYVRAMQRGKAAYDRGDFKGAEVAFKEALSQMPDAAEALNDLGEAQYKTGRYADAQKNFQKAIEVGDVDQRARASYNLGNTMAAQKKLKEAADAYKTSLRYNENDEEARHNLQVVLDKMKPPPDKKQPPKPDDKKTPPNNQKDKNNKNQSSNNKDGQGKNDQSNRNGKNGQGQNKNPQGKNDPRQANNKSGQGKGDNKNQQGKNDPRQANNGQQGKGQPQQGKGQPQQGKGQPQQGKGQPQQGKRQPQQAQQGQPKQGKGQPQQAQQGQPKQGNGQPQQAQQGQPKQGNGQAQQGQAGQAQAARGKQGASAGHSMAAANGKRPPKDDAERILQYYQDKERQARGKAAPQAPYQPRPGEETW